MIVISFISYYQGLQDRLKKRASNSNISLYTYQNLNAIVQMILCLVTLPDLAPMLTVDTATIFLARFEFCLLYSYIIHMPSSLVLLLLQVLTKTFVTELTGTIIPQPAPDLVTQQQYTRNCYPRLHCYQTVHHKQSRDQNRVPVRDV